MNGSKSKAKNGLIIVAHGSRKKQSNEEVISLVKRISGKAEGIFDIVGHAFLQMADPGFEERIDEFVKTGVSGIVIFPFFIGSGSHILVDIPEAVRQAELKYDHVKFRLTRQLGKLAAIEDIIIEEVTK